jgi:hypothetical protein
MYVGIIPPRPGVQLRQPEDQPSFWLGEARRALRAKARSE